MKRIQVSKIEPAPRPHTIALSDAEMAALINYHLREAKATSARLGKAIIQLRAGSLFSVGRREKELITHTEKHIEAHLNRTRGLISIMEHAAINP